MSDLPPVTSKACQECPWRKDSRPGHLGPHDAESWARSIHGEQPIACHKTIKDVDPDTRTGDWAHPKMRQCFGAAQMRKNVFKAPRDPEIAIADAYDDSMVFGHTNDFIEHHRKDAT